MAKVIKYKLCSIVKELKEVPNILNEDEPAYEHIEKEVFHSVVIPWSEKNEEIAKKEF